VKTAVEPGPVERTAEGDPSVAHGHQVSTRYAKDSSWNQVLAQFDVQDIVHVIVTKPHARRSPAGEEPVLDLYSLSTSAEGVSALPNAWHDQSEAEQFHAVPLGELPSVYEWHKTEAVYRRYAIVAESDLREAGAKLTIALGTGAVAASPSDNLGDNSVTPQRERSLNA
jgi:hypothetical protein